MIHEYFGSLKKRETLSPLTSEICAGAFVLNSPEPFPGSQSYYGEHPHDLTPLYVYLMLEESYPLDRILRATGTVKDKKAINFEAAPCKIILDKKKYYAIRIRGIESYQELPSIIEGYRDEEIEFQSMSLRKKGGDALIAIDKFFKIMPVGEGLFIGSERTDHGYITIPRRLSWKEFEELTKQVKFNWSHPEFDVAIAYYFDQYQVYDIIRLYHPEMNQEYLRMAQQVFLSRIEE